MVRPLNEELSANLAVAAFKRILETESESRGLLSRALVVHEKCGTNLPKILTFRGLF